MHTTYILRFLYGFVLFCSVVSLANAQKNVPTHIPDEKYIREWLVIGPFLPDDLETDFLADVGSGEVNIEPKAGDTVTLEGGQTLMWKRYRAKGKRIDLLDAIGIYENATA
nr:hypothetical protein [bacterium]